MNINVENIKAVKIVFFSGTGGVKRIAEAFKLELLKRGLEVSLNNLDYFLNNSNNQYKENTPLEDFVILIFPLHAFDAPNPIYDWIRHNQAEQQRIAVISVSGGGEIWPNTGCRNNCCKELEQRGFKVVYERMMCMPSNWVFPNNDHVAMWLIKVIPKKVSKIVDHLLSGIQCRTNYKMGF
ncbi:MAG: hypothetical protein ACOYIB_08425 [Desulfosporosinus sp.]